MQASINGPCGPVTLPPYDIWVGTPPPIVTGIFVWHQGQEVEVHCLNAGQEATMRAQPSPLVVDYLWSLHGEGGYSQMLGNQPASLPFSISGNHPPRMVEVRQQMQGCSWNISSRRLYLCTGRNLLLVNPNTASREITIAEVEPTDDKSLWDLRLMSQTGVAITSISTTLPKTINVQGLQPGVYVLNAHRGQHGEQLVVVIE